MAAAAPLVSGLLAVADGERHVRAALESLLRQTLTDLELVVVDDASHDSTPEILASIGDPRVRVLRNERRSGLAASLNRGLDEARGMFVARLDADDVALPRRLERQVERLRGGTPPVAVVGSAVLELDAVGAVGALHRMPAGADAVRWAALFSSPFLHPTVLVERAALERHGLRYDPEYLESEDYDLWARLLALEDGDNVEEPLVLYRVHPEQASQRRAGLQRGFQERIALREIARVAPSLTSERRELAWRIGAGLPVDRQRVEDAAEAFFDLLVAFEGRAGVSVRDAAAQALLRAGLHADGRPSAAALRAAARLSPGLPLAAAARRAGRLADGRTVRREARAWLAALPGPGDRRPLRVAAVFPEPTPYRSPLLDRVAASPGIELDVVYAADTVVAGRTWAIERRHSATVLRGLRMPGAERLVHHDYPITPGVVSALASADPDVVVVSGWSTFAAQAAIAWCRLRRVPYVLLVESHDAGRRPGWRRTVKGNVVPALVRGASSVLVAGTLARRSMLARGAAPERVRVFANTVDVEEFGRQADALAPRRAELREALGAGDEDVLVLSVGRLAAEKDYGSLVEAIAAAGDPRLLLVLVGDGPERERLRDLARARGVRLELAGNREWEQVVEAYVAADVFALLSTRETWGVVVNEAAACGLPLLLSDTTGAAHDLLEDGRNGVLVASGDVEAAAAALRRLAADAELRRAYGERSRELAAGWGYEPSVEAFLEAVREAAGEAAARESAR